MLTHWLPLIPWRYQDESWAKCASVRTAAFHNWYRCLPTVTVQDETMETEAGNSKAEDLEDVIFFYHVRKIWLMFSISS